MHNKDNHKMNKSAQMKVKWNRKDEFVGDDAVYKVKNILFWLLTTKWELICKKVFISNFLNVCLASQVNFLFFKLLNDFWRFIQIKVHFLLYEQQEGNKWFILRKFIFEGDERKIQVLRNCYELCEISLQTFFVQTILTEFSSNKYKSWQKHLLEENSNRVFLLYQVTLMTVS